MNMTPVLKGERLILRAFEPKDLRGFADYRAQAGVACYQSWSTEFGLADAEALYQGIDYANFGVNGEWYQLAIADSLTDELMGDLALHFIDSKQVEVGFTLNPLHQHKGLAFEALKTLLGYLFGSLKIHRVIAQTDTRNAASCRLLEKIGFRQEAHFVQGLFFKGQWVNEYLYALLSSEFNVSQPDK